MGSVIIFVIADALIAVITAHRSITIPNILSINTHIAHNHASAAFQPALKIQLSHHHLLVEFNIVHLRVRLNVHSSHFHNIIFELFPSLELLIFTTVLSQPSPVLIHSHTTVKNKKPNDKAATTYTGIIANAINSFILNFQKNHSQPPSFYQRNT